MSLERLHNYIASRQRLLIITGAGVSTGSGIPDYRDKNGDWKRKQPMYYQEFVGDMMARKRYWARSMQGWPVFSAAQPNSVHAALAEIEQHLGVIGLITQNVDRLHQAAGSQLVIDLHGRLDQVKCLSCGSVQKRSEFQRRLEAENPDWQALEVTIAPDGDADLESTDFAEFVVPECGSCGGMLKPDVVFYGENVPKERVFAAQTWSDECDGVLVLGSSLMVWSSFRIVRAAAERNIPVVAVNDGKTRADHLLQWKLEMDCGLALEQAKSNWSAASVNSVSQC